MYNTILFDLDGTVTEPGLGITNSVMYALKKYGISVADRSELYKFIGPPLHESFEVFYGMDREQAMQAVAYYREYYADKGLYENTLYTGMKELLQSLKEKGKTILLATSKPTVYAGQILEHFDLLSYFDLVAGSNLDGSRTKKDEVIEYAIAEYGITDRSDLIMVGDRKHDIEGAKKCGLKSIGVLYGYGDREELTTAGADYIAETVEDIGKFVL